ncbi:DNA-directed RNA polymerase [Candidatus Woesearchaeota archaeon]|nr:DNA-directed RNA polymerase [Candidatus Woesearchaeota archaeon]MBW3006322.1 DNA-directed RNA polymerase [Candidatus Woesearchaeota archaeon]
MFYKIELKDYIRVPPRYFDLDVKEAVLKSVKLKYDGLTNAEFGFVIDIVNVKDIGEGVIIPGDGASYYATTFEVIAFKPELQEVVVGRIKDIADFGAFLTMGPIDGMIHISQTMDDFVSFAKDKVLTGRDSKKVLKVGDLCRARVIAVSFKDITNPKIGLTMRQQGLGKLEWIEEEGKETPAKEEKKATAKKAAGKKK